MLANHSVSRHSVRVFSQTDTMLSRQLVILIVAIYEIAFANRNRLHPDLFKLRVGILYRRESKNADNIFRRSLENHTPDHSKYTFHLVKQHYTSTVEFDVTDQVCNLFNRGANVIVAMTPPSPTRGVYERLLDMSNRFHIPLIIYSMPEVDHRLFQFTLMIKPSTTRASLDLMQYYGWKKVIYIRGEDRRTFQKELDSRASPYNFVVDIDFTITGELDAVMPLLSKQVNVTSEKELHVVLNTSPDISKEIIFEYANQQINKRIHFIVLEPFVDSSWVKRFENTNLKVTIFNLVDPNNRRFQSLRNKNASPVDTLLSEEAGAVLGTAFDQLYKFKSDVFHHMTHNNREHVDQCTGTPPLPLIHGLDMSLEIKRNVTVEGCTGNLEFDIHGQRKNYVLGITEITTNANIEIGTWSDRAGLKMHIQMPFPIQVVATKLPEKRIVITSILEQPYLVKYGKSYVGLCKDLADLLSNKVKFKYDLKLVDDGHYGSYNNYTGKWNGMIGEIVDGKAEIAVAPLIMTARRSLAVDFTIPFQDHGITLLLKNSKGNQSLCYLVFCPFTWQLWIFIFSVYVVFSILSILIYRYADSSKHKNEYGGDIPQWYTRSWPLRMLLLVCLIFTVIIISMYIASLGTILSHQQFSSSNVRSLEFKDVFKKSVQTGSPKMLLLRYGSTMAFFQRSTTPLYKKYWNQVTADPSHFVKTYREGIHHVMESNGETAMFIDSAAGEYLSSKNCDLQITSGYLKIRSYAVALRLGHPLRNSLNEAILSLRENESLDNLYSKWWKSKCPRSHDTENMDLNGKPLELMDMDGLFYMLTVGFGLIVLTTGIHLFYQKGRTSAKKPVHVPETQPLMAK